jgi:hypothetical protein
MVMDIKSAYEDYKEHNRVDKRAFPALDEQEMAVLRLLGKEETYADGQFVFRAGDADIDFFVVESGQQPDCLPQRRAFCGRYRFADPPAGDCFNSCGG